MATRTYTINIYRDPSISGYGGYDEWTLEDLTGEEADKFLAMLDSIVRNMGIITKKPCYFSGAT